MGFDLDSDDLSLDGIMNFAYNPLQDLLTEIIKRLKFHDGREKELAVSLSDSTEDRAADKEALDKLSSEIGDLKATKEKSASEKETLLGQTKDLEGRVHKLEDLVKEVCGTLQKQEETISQQRKEIDLKTRTLQEKDAKQQAEIDALRNQVNSLISTLNNLNVQINDLTRFFNENLAAKDSEAKVVPPLEPVKMIEAIPTPPSTAPRPASPRNTIVTPREEFPPPSVDLTGIQEDMDLMRDDISRLQGLVDQLRLPPPMLFEKEKQEEVRVDKVHDTTIRLVQPDRLLENTRQTSSRKNPDSSRSTNNLDSNRSLERREKSLETKKEKEDPEENTLMSIVTQLPADH